jgi:hypothetical protein
MVSDRLVDGVVLTFSQVPPLFFEYSTMKLRTGLPFITVEAFQPSTTDVFEALMLSELGAAGALPTVTAEITADVADAPIAFTALTLKQYLVPALRPVTDNARSADAARLIAV